MTSRPLSRWVCTAPLDDEGRAVLVATVEPNDGEPTRDARGLDRYRWTEARRAAVDVVGPDGSLLVPGVSALVAPGRTRVLLELDDWSRPIPLSPAGPAALTVVDDLIDGRPVTATGLDGLRGEAEAIVVAAVARLVAARPDLADQVCALLPWEMIDQVVDVTTANLTSATTRPAPPLRHRFLPVGSRFSAALDQLAAAAEDGDRDLVAQAASWLGTELAETPEGRLPEQLRARVAALAARAAGSRADTDAGERSLVTLEGRLRTDGRTIRPREFSRAAASLGDGERRFLHTRIDRMIVDVQMDSPTRAIVVVDLTEVPGAAPGALVAVGANRPEPLLVLAPLVEAGSRLSATVRLSGLGRDWDLRVVEAWLHPDGVLDADPALIRASLRQPDGRTRRAWRTLARLLPTEHLITRLILDLLGDG